MSELKVIYERPFRETITRKNAESPQFPKYMQSKHTVTYKPFQEVLIGIGKNPTYHSNKFGNSYESPTYFRSKYSIVCKDTYKNPFIETEAQEPEARKTDGFKLKHHMFLNYLDKNCLENVFGPLGRQNERSKVYQVKDYVQDPVKVQRKISAKNSFIDFHQKQRSSRLGQEMKNPNSLSRITLDSIGKSDGFKSFPQLNRCESLISNTIIRQDIVSMANSRKGSLYHIKQKSLCTLNDNDSYQQVQQIQEFERKQKMLSRESEV